MTTSPRCEVPEAAPWLSTLALLAAFVLALATVIWRDIERRRPTEWRTAARHPGQPDQPTGTRSIQPPSGWWGNARDDGPEMARWRQREIRKLWREVCELSPLAQWIPMPSGVTLACPTIETVILGKPTAILVRLRPGQLPSDIEAHAARIAYTMEAGGLRILETEIPMRLRIEFLDDVDQHVGYRGHDVTHLPLWRPGAAGEDSGDGRAA